MENSELDEIEVDEVETTSKGLFEFADGGRYVGEWGKDGAQGHGVCTLPSEGGTFEGLWSSGNQVSGRFNWSSGQTYTGTWKNGMRHGQGIEVKPDGMEYVGDFRENIRGSYGVLKLPNGAVYQGTWENGLQDGIGVELYVDKGTYKGQYKRGQREGYGTRSTSAYESYSSTTNKKTDILKPRSPSLHSPPIPRPNSARSLKAWTSTTEVKAFDSNSQIYEGQWKNDKREGHGILKVPGKYTYFGEWRNNSRTGYGVLVHQDGQREEGCWENGQLVTALKRKKLSIKHHQIENKVKQSHTIALQVADQARNKAVLAESKASGAISRSKSAQQVAETAQKDADIAIKLSHTLLECQSKTLTTSSTSPLYVPLDLSTKCSLTVSESTSLLSVPTSISPSPSFEAIDSIVEHLNSSMDSLESETAASKFDDAMSDTYSDPGTVSTTGSIVSDPGILIKVDESNPVGKKRRFSKQPRIVKEDSETPPMRKRSMSDNIVNTLRHRVPRIDKSTGELTNSADNTDDELNEENRKPTNHQPITPSPLQHNVNIDVLNQMANWNKMFAYINFILLIFLLLLIVVMVAFMSSTLSYNNPTAFMTHMA